MVPLKENIDWVGCVDWNVRDFHSYDTARGATYNAYLIRGEKNVLIDTVKAPFVDELLRNVRERVELDRIDYVVCNHSELDHAGALPAVMKALPNATLLCNAKCRETLAGYFDTSDWKIDVIAPERPLSLGSWSLAFVNIPMVHWPESMVTYMPEEQLLFSNDAFGQHLATTVRFDDEWDLSQLLQEAKSYYANIVTPYGRQVLKTLDVVSKLKLNMIAPSHGLIWRKNIPAIVSAYTTWASGKCDPKVLILYDTMWESTGQMAREILRGVTSVEGVRGEAMHVRKTTLTRIATELLDAGAVAFGSSTLNAGMMPQMGAVLTYVKGLKFSPRNAMAFGSYGWGPGGPEAIDQCLQEMKYPIVQSMIKSRWRPTSEILEACFNAGVELARGVR